MFFRSPRVLVSTFVFALVQIAAGAQFTVTLEIRPGTEITGGSSIVVEAFIRNDGPDIDLSGIQLDLPCIPPGLPGAVGELRTQPVGGCATFEDCPAGITCYPPFNPNGCLSVSVNDVGSSVPSGSVPWLFAPFPPNDHLKGGVHGAQQGDCRFGGGPNGGEPAYVFPGGGTRRYVGTIRYQASPCAAGTFIVDYAFQNVPCNISDLTRMVDDDYHCVEVDWQPLEITIPVGACCDGNTCVADGINRECCYSNYGANVVWREGRTCAESTVCDCATDGECDDTSFCNGEERCADAHCVRGTPVTCPESLFPCAVGVCDPGTDRCREQIRSSGYPCTIEGGCISGAICDGASPHCTGPPVAGGTPCDDGDLCTTADTCNNSGACVAGAEIPCDDGLACNGLETCNPATGCVPGDPLCGPAEVCDEATGTCHPAVIPTTSAWGLVIFALAIATAAKTCSAQASRNQVHKARLTGDS